MKITIKTRGLILYGVTNSPRKNQAFGLNFLYFILLQMKELELKTVWELSPEELEELDLQEGDELALFEGDPDRMDTPGMDENWLTESNRIYFFIRSEKNMVVTSYETEYSSELLEFCKGQDTRVSISGYNSRSESGNWEYLEKNDWEGWEECKNLKIAYRGGCGYVYTLFEYKN